MRTITQTEVINAAEAAIQRRELTGSRAARLRKAARTVKYIVIGGWRLPESGKLPACGCLVGTAYPRLGHKLDRDGDSTENESELMYTGYDFDRYAREALDENGKRYFQKREGVKEWSFEDGYGVSERVKVVSSRRD